MEATAPQHVYAAPQGAPTQPVPIPQAASPERANQRSDKDFARANRHSRLVSILKLALPAAACLMLFIFISSALLSYVPLADVSVDSAGLKDGKLVMERPKMDGFDKNNRPYKVKAEQAIQDLTNPDVVELLAIDARLPMDATSFADVDAKSGTYNSVKETLLLHDKVTIKGARGMDIFLEDADIDIKTGSMKSQKPVKVISHDTNITADSVEVGQNGKRILFKDRVKMTITRPIKRGTSDSN